MILKMMRFGSNCRFIPRIGLQGRRWKTDLHLTRVKLAENDKDFNILKRLLKLVWPKNEPSIKFRVISSLSLLVAGKGVLIYVPVIYKQLIDACTSTDTHSLAILGFLSAAYGISRLVAVGFQELRNAVFTTVSQSIMRNTAKQVYDHLLHLDQEFHVKSHTGGLVRAIDRGTKGINNLLSAMVLHILPTIFEISAVCGVLLYNFGFEYAIVMLGTVFCYTAFTVLTTQWRVPFRKQMNAADNKAASIATDSLLNIQHIQMSNNQDFSTARYDQALRDYEVAAIKSNKSLSFLNGGQSAIFSISLGIVMYMASKGVALGTLTVGDIVMINGLLFQISFPLNFLGSVYRDTRQSLIDMKSMFDNMSIKSKILESQKYPKFEYKRGEIVFDNVYFEYSDGRKVLNGISLTIPAGKSVAFVGPSGCGKSTLLKLIARLHDPVSGKIMVDGQNVAKVDLKSLRESFGTVPQDTILFNISIYDNIRYGNLTATREDVYNAAKKAALHELIEERFPQKYDTIVGERGVKVSGGEKQRIQISRLFVNVFAF
jgi:ABC transporter ATM